MNCTYCARPVIWGEDEEPICTNPDCPEHKIPGERRDFFTDAAHWECECGEVCDPLSQNWRFAGHCWQHFHGYPIGHVDAKRIDDLNPEGTARDVGATDAGPDSTAS